MIEELNPSIAINLESKANQCISRFQSLLEKLREQDLPAHVVTYINERIRALNAMDESEKVFRNKVKRVQAQILSRLEKTVKLVAKNHYQNMWMALGVGAFGLPLGVAFGAALGNMGLLGIGLPIGIAIGLAIGAAMDKKAAEEGRQLDF
ncbi:MAG TPA: hypothetical protein DCE41_11525 [Cytophagales bacterium]|nr:hypothetical protein [Cytophagales bacterium]HAA22323.1 hypothetical protein [Cytophagales bacterium]HAP60466.1 hypothetical protein [Cytophagales bacterium]